VRADQVLDLLTLTGDTVDNVPGVAKVGPKTAARWLAQYGSLDAIVAHANEIPGVVGENLRAALDWIPQGRRLLTVKTDCALPVGPADLTPAPPDVAALHCWRRRRHGGCRGRRRRGARRHGVARRYAQLRAARRAGRRRAGGGSPALRGGAGRGRLRALAGRDRAR
jgi:5'-3' exonuclease